MRLSTRRRFAVISPASSVRRGLLRACGALVAAVSLCASDTPAAGMKPVDVYVLAVGDGSAVWDGGGGSVSIFKFTTDGTPQGTRFRNSWDAPASGPGRVVIPRNSSSTGQLLLSGNGRLLTFAGSAADANASPGELAGADKVIGVFDIAAGVFDTTTRLGDRDNFKATPDVRAAYTIDGREFWIVGQGFPETTRGLRYAAAGGTTSTALTTDNSNWRNMTVHDGTLYAVSRDLDPKVSLLAPKNPAGGLAGVTRSGRAAFVPQAGITGGAGAYAEGIARAGDFLFVGSNDRSAANSGISVYRLDDKTSRWHLVTRLNPAALGAPRHQVSQLAAHEAGGVIYLFFDAGGIQADSLNVVTWNPATLSFSDLKVLYAGGAGCTFKGIALSAARP